MRCHFCSVRWNFVDCGGNGGTRNTAQLFPDHTAPQAPRTGQNGEKLQPPRMGPCPEPPTGRLDPKRLPLFVGVKNHWEIFTARPRPAGESSNQREKLVPFIHWNWQFSFPLENDDENVSCTQSQCTKTRLWSLPSNGAIPSWGALD